MSTVGQATPGAVDGSLEAAVLDPAPVSGSIMKPLLWNEALGPSLAAYRRLSSQMLPTRSRILTSNSAAGISSMKALYAGECHSCTYTIKLMRRRPEKFRSSFYRCSSIYTDHFLLARNAAIFELSPTIWISSRVWQLSFERSSLSPHCQRSSH